MAKVQIKMPDEFLERLSKLGDRFDTSAPRVLEAGAKVLVSQARSNLQAAIGKNLKYKARSKGDLVRSLGVTPALQDRDGNWNIKVGVGDSTDADGVPNALKAQVLEYGKHGQPPKPWLKPARSKSKGAILDAMKKELESELMK